MPWAKYGERLRRLWMSSSLVCLLVTEGDDVICVDLWSSLTSFRTSRVRFYSDCSWRYINVGLLYDGELTAFSETTRDLRQFIVNKLQLCDLGKCGRFSLPCMVGR